MGATIQIRNMPEDVHRKLKARAAEAGVTLSAYLIKEFERVAQTPTEVEMKRRAEDLWGKQSAPDEKAD